MECPLQVVECLPQFGVLFGDRGEQFAVLALVVGGQGAAETVAEQQEVSCGRSGGFSRHRFPGHDERFAESVVHAASLGSGHQPGFSPHHGDGRRWDDHIVGSLGPAPPCLARPATGTRR